MRGQPMIYWRERGGTRRAYADLRLYADVGGKREALVPDGKTQATDDPALAQALYGQRVAYYHQRRLRAVHGLQQPMSLAACAKDYLVAKEGEVTRRRASPSPTSG